MCTCRSGNILLTDGIPHKRRAKLGDLGLARTLQMPVSTAVGVQGTFIYMVGPRAAHACVDRGVRAALVPAVHTPGCTCWLLPESTLMLHCVSLRSLPHAGLGAGLCLSCAACSCLPGVTPCACWQAPEQLFLKPGMELSTKADTYSFGVVLWEVRHIHIMLCSRCLTVVWLVRWQHGHAKSC